jgi:hypothetical protein
MIQSIRSLWTFSAIVLLIAGRSATCCGQDVLMGMKIEKVHQADSGITVVTTGAEFLLGKDGGIDCFQRIPTRREVAHIELPQKVLPLSIKEQNNFACVVSGEGITLMLQGDSLIILKAEKDCGVNFEGLFKPAYHANKEGKWLFIDGTGGFGVYPVEQHPDQTPDLNRSEWNVEYRLKKGNEIWFSVFPPRPYNWRRAYKDLMAHEGNEEPYRFPTDDLIRSTAKHCNVLVTHSWFWPGGDRDPWMIPEYVFKNAKDREKFDHMRDETHRYGMKLIPYCSPFYYSGKDYFGDIRRVLNDYKADGLYFDGITFGDFRKSYEVIRKTRKLLGDRLLFRHCTSDPLESNRIYCPFIDTYCDYVYRGEQGRAGLSLDDFLRWTVSGYNISNAVGYWIYTGSTGKPGYVRQVPSKADIDAAIRNEVRIPRTEIGYEQGLAWKPGDGHLRFFDDYYYGAIASLYDKFQKVIGREDFAKYPGTPAQFLVPKKSSGKSGGDLRVATFCCNATPPLGQPLFEGDPIRTVEEPLLAKGILLEAGTERYVLCAFDWCEICNGSHDSLQSQIAAAAGADPAHVAVQCVHQHTAPLVDIDAQKLLAEVGATKAHLDPKVLDQIEQRLVAAVKQSLVKLEPFDQIGTGQAKVDRVASSRRPTDGAGKIHPRYSICKDAALQAMPEGTIDPCLKTITFARGQNPLVRLHYYATHPQTSFGHGHATSDFPGMAREELERKEGVFQIYFTACAGDVTVGKYNDGSQRCREELAQRLLAGMEASVAATKLAPVGQLRWRTVPVVLPRRTDRGFSKEDCLARMKNPKSGGVGHLYAGAIRLASLNRSDRPITLSCLEIGDTCIVHLPGEPMIAFQQFAQGIKPGAFVAVAGYGDGATGYICPAQAFREGGYEPTSSNLKPECEVLLKKAIAALLGVDETPGRGL